MASTSSTSFERSLDQFREHLSKDQKQQFNSANRHDLDAAIQDTQAKLGRDKRLCNFRRIEKFLDAMGHVEKLVTIFLNVHEVVAFVWAPIKLALMAATSWVDTIKPLLDAYEEIGEALSNLAFFHPLIRSKGAEHLRQALEDYFSDILRFHRCVLDVFSRPNLKTFFKAAWGSFRRKIEPIIRALKLRQEKLSHERLQAHAIHEGVRDFRGHADDRFDKLAADLDSIRSTLESECLRRQTSSEDQDMKEFLEDKLNISRLRWHSRLDSPEPSSASAGDWVIHHPDFQAWERAISSERSVLFLNGSPGAGKTTLAMKIIRYLTGKDPMHGSTVYFFFRHDDDDRKSAKPMLRAILSQLIEQDETIMRYLYEKSTHMSRNLELSSLTTLQDLAQDCLTSQRGVSIVLDGLDECAENEPSAIIPWFLNKVLPSAVSRGCHLKLLVCGQRDGRLDQLLSEQPQIRLDMVDPHRRDIEEYSKSQAARICARFKRRPEQGEELATKVAETSKGMFLYANVVMSNLLSMCTIREFEDEMRSSTVPEDLDQAYERIIQRILGEGHSSQQRAAKKILGWTISSKRPLRWREIQSRFSIDADSGTCDTACQILDRCKDICSSLVDVTACDLFRSAESEEIVHMVHETAGKYLIQRGIINLLQEHVDTALFCCRYLSSRPFLQHAESDSFQNALRSGYFGLLDYAAVHYPDHVQEALEHASSLPADVVTSAMGLLAAYSSNLPNESILETEACVQAVANALRAKNIAALIQSRVVVIRAATESQHHDLSKENSYLDLCGPLRFKCPRLCCPKFTIGFGNQSTRDGHLERHERPYRCAYTDCFLQGLGYESRERLEAHCEAFHRDTVNLPVTFPSTKETNPEDIFEACKKGNLELVKKFHLAGAQLGISKTKTHATPLYLATQGKHAKVCEYLVSQGADPFKSKKYGREILSPVLLAFRQGNAPLIELFFKHETGISQYPPHIAIAIRDNRSEVLELLLRLEPYLDHTTIVEDVFRELVNPDRYTIRFVHVEPPADSSLVHTWFRRAFPNLYRHGTSAAGAYCLLKRPDFAEYRTCQKTLLRSGSGLLHKALRENCHPLSLFLLDFAEKGDLQLADEDGLLPIDIIVRSSCSISVCEKHRAVMNRFIEVDGGASVNTPDKNGNLSIHKAVRSQCPNGVAQAIILHTTNLNHKNREGESPIHAALSNLDGLSMLLATGRIHFITNNLGQTIFSSASAKYSVQVQVLQVLHRADPTLAYAPDVTQDKKTPLHHIMTTMEMQDVFGFQEEKATFLLSLPTAEHHVLPGFSASPAEDNASACQRVREFARKKGLKEAIEIMDRIGFGL